MDSLKDRVRWQSLKGQTVLPRIQQRLAEERQDIPAYAFVLSSDGEPVLQAHPWGMVAVALLVFPKLALGLSGFETGVAVMPQVKNGVGDTEGNPAGRIAGTKRLLTAAAVIMSTFLMTSSLFTTWLIPQHEFEAGGEANGRALAFLAHQEFGDVFGTVYDLSTIGILWFAGASALAGMLNLIPRYLPRFGMAPEWARANRPLVLVLAVIAIAITLFFEADVDAQGAAYATGVLVLMTSAAIAVMLSAKRRHQKAAFIYFTIVVLVFLYTTVANVIERPDDIRIAALFIVGIVIVSFLSRFRRSLGLRATSVTLDEDAKALIKATSSNGRVKLVAHEAMLQSEERYRAKYKHARYAHQFAEDDNKVVFIEISVGDSSDFAQDIHVTGTLRYGFPVLEASGSAVPTAIAAIALQIRDEMGVMPHVYFRWTEGNPVKNLLRFLFLGQGEIAPVTREILREAVPDITQRPWIHLS